MNMSVHFPWLLYRLPLPFVTWAWGVVNQLHQTTEANDFLECRVEVTALGQIEAVASKLLAPFGNIFLLRDTLQVAPAVRSSCLRRT